MSSASTSMGTERQVTTASGRERADTDEPGDFGGGRAPVLAYTVYSRGRHRWPPRQP